MHDGGRFARQAVSLPTLMSSKSDAEVFSLTHFVFFLFFYLLFMTW